MAHKTLQEFYAPSLQNIPTGPRFEVQGGVPEFELKSSLINLGKLHNSVERHMKMLVYTCRIS